VSASAALKSRRKGTRLRWLAGAGIAVAVAVPASLAFATFHAFDSNNAAARADSLAKGSTPTVNLVGRDVTISWTASSFVGLPATSASGYRVARYAATSGLAPVVVACAPSTNPTPPTPATALTTCTERNVPSGNWAYAVTPTFGSWIGPESDRTPVAIAVATCAVTPGQAFPSTGGRIRGVVVTNFRSEERIEFRVDASTGPIVAGDGESSDGDGATRTFTLRLGPNAADPGAHVLVAIGSRGSKADCAPRFIIDNIAPATIVTPDAVTEWANKSVGVTLAATDTGGAGVADIRYALSGAQFQRSRTIPGTSTSVTIDAAGATTMTYFATDKAGNSEAPRTFVVKIDKTAPRSSITFTPRPVDGWVAAGATAAVTAADVGSGVSRIDYAINGVAASGPASGIIAIAGSTTITAHATDAAGNVETPEVTASVRVDGDGPTGTIGAPSPATIGGTTTLVANVSDAGSGVASVQFERSPTTGPTTWTPIGAAQTGDGPNYSVAFDTSAASNGSYVVRMTMKDKVGNTSTSTPQPITVANVRATTLALTNGTGSVGRVDEGDQIVVGFDGAIAPGSVCSALTTTNPFAADGAITVTLNDAGGTRNDTMTVTAAPSVCSPNGLKLGTITLGSATYLQGEDDDHRKANFVGAGAHATKLAWNADTNTLTITLGSLTPTSGRPRPVPAPAVPASYVPDGAITSATGTAIVVQTVRTSGVAVVF